MSEAPGPACKVTEHPLGPLANPWGMFTPVHVAADAYGALAIWAGPGGLQLQRLDKAGLPEGGAAKAPGEWRDIAPFLLSREEAVLVRIQKDDIVVSRFERASLRSAGERTIPRPKGMDRFLESTLVGRELLLVGARGQELLFLHVGLEGAPRSATINLPRALPDDASATLGHWGTEMAVLVTTISGGVWLASETRMQDYASELVQPLEGPFVRIYPLDARTGPLPFGLQPFPRYPLPRPEDAALLEKRPLVAFRLTSTYGFPESVWTGSHFLLGEAAGEWDSANLDNLQARVSAVDCSGK